MKIKIKILGILVVFIITILFMGHSQITYASSEIPMKSKVTITFKDSSPNIQNSQKKLPKTNENTNQSLVTLGLFTIILSVYTYKQKNGEKNEN